MAGPFTRADFDKLVPADKKLSREWIESLYARGSRTVYRGGELKYIGMPVGGICAGQVYLGGDGGLWHWDIFNIPMRTGAQNYARPLEQESPVSQGFAVRIKSDAGDTIHTLDRAGFSDVSFCGEYPIGTVEYRDGNLPLAVSLEAFSPFIPLNTSDSALPATVMRFTVKNTSQSIVEAELAGWLENAAALNSAKFFAGMRRNTIVRRKELTLVACSVEPSHEPAQPERPATVFANFDGESYGEWKVQGKAFGERPARGAPGAGQKLHGQQGKGLVNTWLRSDEPRGKLTSPKFTIERPFVSFLIGGGNHPGETCVNLVIGDRIVRSSTGKNSDAMGWDSWNVRDLMGQTAKIEIVDAHSGAWGHIDIDQIEFRDQPRGLPGTLEQQPDFGTMTLALLNPEADDFAQPGRDVGSLPGAAFITTKATPGTQATYSISQRQVGSVGRRWRLKPGQSAVATFVVTWCFPNLRLDRLPEGRRYAKQFASATAVAEHVARNFERLHAETRLWRDTWYDSTLPYWLLDRTFANTSILASSTCYWLGNGRFYGWEGVGCCPGTCAHVWHYAQAVGRLFPELERSVREMVDFGLAMDPETGSIGFRGEFHKKPAIDGQAGCILRAYREHQMSADDGFLKRNWPNIKRAIEYLIAQDENADGILEGRQHNTLDADWYGPVAWLSGLYLAALRAGEEMAREMGDEAFAQQTHAIVHSGGQKITELLFDGEYFINKPDKTHPEAINSGTGCEIDQVFGQSWAFQLGLGRVLPEQSTRTALRSLWRYNFSPDVGPYREANPVGRWYAMAGEAGLLMCTFPRTDWDLEKAKGAGRQMTFVGYFNECMTGFEYQVASHMLWEGMIEEGLAITRAVHDRYHASRRNPWNEVECGDHYARAMASYGVFLAVCGYEYHGPKGYLAFAPRLTPADFRAPFTTADGWGTFEQRREGQQQRETLTLRWGKLALQVLAFTPADKAQPTRVKVTLAGKPVAARHTIEDGRVVIRLASETVLSAGNTLEVVMS
jgi:uncharacterized protein (DUF608 family)